MVKETAEVVNAVVGFIEKDSILYKEFTDFKDAILDERENGFIKIPEERAKVRCVTLLRILSEKGIEKYNATIMQVGLIAVNEVNIGGISQALCKKIDEK